MRYQHQCSWCFNDKMSGFPRVHGILRVTGKRHPGNSKQPFFTGRKCGNKHLFVQWFGIIQLKPPFQTGCLGYQVLVKMWIFSKCLSQKGPEKEESCFWLPMSFSDFLKHNDTHTQRHTNKPTWQNSKCFFFNKASGWNSCPFRWDEGETAGTQKLFSTLGDMFTLEVIKDILWRPAECKSSIKQA